MKLDLGAGAVSPEGFIGIAFIDPWDMPKLTGVYAIRNTANGKVYVGSSNNVRTRCMGHRRKLVRGVHDNEYIQSDWSVGHSFVWNVLERVSDIGQLARIEAKYIELLRCSHDLGGYNLIINPGTGALAAAVRAKMSAKQKGRAAYNKGVPCPEHVKELNRLFHTGRKRTPETCAKLREVMLGPSHPHRGAKLRQSIRRAMESAQRAEGPKAGEFKGVNFDKRTKTFSSRIYANGKQIFLGRYRTATEAAKAYNIAATDLYGYGCYLNDVPEGVVPARRVVLGRPSAGGAHV